MNAGPPRAAATVGRHSFGSRRDPDDLRGASFCGSSRLAQVIDNPLGTRRHELLGDQTGAVHQAQQAATVWAELAGYPQRRRLTSAIGRRVAKCRAPVARRL